MIIRNLHEIPPETIVDCLLIAFENYFVKMPSGHDYWINRWQGARVDYSLSAGIFDGEKLVGFILHGIDKDNDGLLTAFNCATGVLPEYRRKGIVGDLYNYLVPQLKEAGVKKCSLEVITKNNVAIQSYEKVGFAIVREYKCFFGQLKQGEQEETLGYDLIKTATPFWEKYNNIKACEFSWENNERALMALPGDAYDTWELTNEGNLAGYAILKPNGHIVQFGTVNPTEMHVLFDKLATIAENVRVINIDEKDKHVTGFLQERGLANTIDQYYMEYHVN
jgi:ribosomal protein S18 acetylase RimI-like enzyme